MTHSYQLWLRMTLGILPILLQVGGGSHGGPPAGSHGGPPAGFNDSSIRVFSKMPRFLNIFARRRRRHKNGRCGSLLENRRFPRVCWFFMGSGSFEGCFLFYRTFAAQRFVRHLCISKAGTFLSIHFSIFFSRKDVSGQCLRGAEGESSPQSPPAGAFLLKKRKKKKTRKEKKKNNC